MLQQNPRAPVHQHGRIGRLATLKLDFGSWLGGRVPAGSTLVPLPHSGFDASLLRLANGSYLVYGTVGLTRPAKTTAAAAGAVFDIALQGLTPSLAPDPKFGGPATALSLGVTQRGGGVAAVRRGDALNVVVNASAPCLARVAVSAGGALIAESVVPLLSAGHRSVTVALTRAGRSYLRHHPRSTLTLAIAARDLLASSVVRVRPAPWLSAAQQWPPPALLPLASSGEHDIVADEPAPARVTGP